MTKISPKNKNSKIPEPSGVLLNKIILGIRKEQKLKEIRRRVILFSFGLALSLAAVVPSYDLVSGQMLQTGFGDFASLIFSDYSIVADYWDTFAMALLESFPFTESVIFLVVVFLILGSLRLLVQNAKILFGQLNNKAKSFN